MNLTKKVSHRASIALFFMVFMMMGGVLTAQVPPPTPTPTPAPSPTPAPAPQPKFALLVVGDDESDPQSMHNAFGNTGDRVYSTLKAKNYTDDDILYLSWDDTNPNVDDFSTEANISWGLQTWLRKNLDNDKSDETVVIYFIDHGGVNPYWHYYFVPYDNSTNSISDTELRTWVNTALSDWNGNINYKSANIVIDTCKSGWIIGHPTVGLDGPNRIVVTATTGVHLAYSWWGPPPIWFNNHPGDSRGETIFSYFYLKQILAGMHVQTAFDTASPQTSAEVLRLANLSGGTERQFPQISSQHPTPLIW